MWNISQTNNQHVLKLVISYRFNLQEHIKQMLCGNSNIIFNGNDRLEQCYDVMSCFTQGLDGLPGDKGDDGESGQPVSDNRLSLKIIFFFKHNETWE